MRNQKLPIGLSFVLITLFIVSYYNFYSSAKIEQNMLNVTKEIHSLKIQNVLLNEQINNSFRIENFDELNYLLKIIQFNWFSIRDEIKNINNEEKIVEQITDVIKQKNQLLMHYTSDKAIRANSIAFIITLESEIKDGNSEFLLEFSELLNTLSNNVTFYNANISEIQGDIANIIGFMKKDKSNASLNKKLIEQHLNIFLKTSNNIDNAINQIEKLHFVNKLNKLETMFFQSIKKQRINRENRNNLTVAFTFALLIGFLLAFFKIHKDKDRILNLKKEIEKSHKDKENTIMILNQYQKAIDTSYIISITDLKGVITYANDNFIALSGYKKSELIGKTHNIIRHADSPKELFHTLWKTIKDKQIWHGTIKNLHKNGTSYYVDATIFPLLDLNENITSYVAIRNDITEIKHQTDRANTILNSQNSVIIISSFVNDKMEIKQINQKFFDLFNYTDKNDFLLKHNCVCDLFIEREGYLQAIQNNKSWIEILLEEQENSYLALLKDRRQLERIFSVKAKKIDLETESFVISTFTEVTELEQARVEALSAEKAKSAFLSTMSHELRTPLNAVIGFSKILMLKKDMSAEAMKVYIAKINISGEHLLTLVNNILDYSKIDSGTIEINKQSIDLSVLINDALVLIETHANNKKIQIQKSGFINKVIEADAQLLKQVVLNILSNAVKFTPNNSKIILSYKDDEKNHLISICDEGLGLSQEQIKTIFEPFHQIETHQNQNVKGTGLGLSISKKIMQLHNGKIEVESKIGKGSCFTIYLPKSKIKDV